MPDIKTAALLLFCTGGIYGAYLTQGLVSEHLQMKRFGASQERFANLEALNGAQSLVCFIWAYVLVMLQRRASGGAQAAQEAKLPSWYEYWKPALTNSIGPAFGMIALKNISYPVGLSVCTHSHPPHPMVRSTPQPLYCMHPTCNAAHPTVAACPPLTRVCMCCNRMRAHAA